MKINVKEIIKPTAVLTAICLVIVALLAGVNLITGPVIAARENAAASGALLEVYPNGSFGADSEITDLSPYTLPEEITAVYKENNGGYVFKTAVSGYNKSVKMVILCGVDPEGKITGTKVISNQETTEIAAPLFDLTDNNGFFVGSQLNAIPDLLASVTPAYTAAGYTAAVKASLNAFIVMNGGEADLRTPEQILQDNCNEALGTEGKVFTKWFADAMLTGVDSLYLTDGGAVAVIGESFIGINADGVAVGDADAALKTAAEAAYTEYTASIVSLDGLELTNAQKKAVLAVAKSADGSYYFSIKADGYQANFEYGSGEYIFYTLVISADGRIASVETVSHGETKGIASKDALNEYESSFEGKADGDIVVTVPYPDSHGAPQTPGDCTDVGALSGASFTATAYQKTIKTAFAVFEMLTGGVSND